MNKNQKIVIVNQDSGYLMIDIANTYHEAGFQVSLITGRLVERNTPLMAGIKVKNIIRYTKESTIQRLFTWILATIQIWFLLIFKFKNHKVLIVSNPPLAPLLTLFIPNDVSVLIYDIFPDALFDAGVMSRKSIICTLWKKMNIKAYAKTKTIFTISDGMKQVLTQYVTESKIKVVPVWADNEFLKPINVEKNIFIQKNNFSGKYIVLYSGNLGKTGDVECMIEFAKLTKDTDIHYLIIGGGVKSAAIEKSIRDNNLSNCTLLPWQNSEMLPFSLSAASLAVVSLGKNTSNIAMPSKLYSYLAVGAPVLSLSSNDSDLAKLVTKRDFGKNFEPDKIAEIVKYILFLKSNKVEHSKFHINSLETSSLFTKSNAKLFIKN